MPEWTDEVQLEDVEVLNESAHALLIKLDGQTYWVPKNHVSDNSEVYKVGHSGTMIVSAWIAEQKGWV